MAPAISDLQKKGMNGSGYFHVDERVEAYQTSAGNWFYRPSTGSGYSVTVRLDGTMGAASSQIGSGWAGIGDVWRIDDVDVDGLTARAADKARQSVNPQPFPLGIYTVVLEPSAAAAFVQQLAGALRGGSAQVGQKVASEKLTVRTKPDHPQIMASPYGEEGVPAREVLWIRKRYCQEPRALETGRNEERRGDRGAQLRGRRWIAVAEDRRRHEARYAGHPTERAASRSCRRHRERHHTQRPVPDRERKDYAAAQELPGTPRGGRTSSTPSKRCRGLRGRDRAASCRACACRTSISIACLTRSEVNPMRPRSLRCHLPRRLIVVAGPAANDPARARQRAAAIRSGGAAGIARGRARCDPHRAAGRRRARDTLEMGDVVMDLFGRDTQMRRGEAMRRSPVPWVSILLLPLFLEIIAVLPTLAQNAQVTGTVKDQSNAVVPGVTITARNQDTGLARTAVSDDTGAYRVTALPPGKYTVSSELQGFATEMRRDLVLIIGQTATVNFTMNPAAIAETVTVTSAAPIVDTTRSDVTTSVSSQQIQDLPLANTRWIAFAMLTPGVSQDNIRLQYYPGTVDVGGGGREY